MFLFFLECFSPKRKKDEKRSQLFFFTKQKIPQNSGGNVTLANGVVRRNRAGFFGGGSLRMFTSLGVQNVSFDSNA